MLQDYNSLYEKIGYKFRNQSYLVRALTHRSKGKKNYERLEFLGDSLLGFVIAEALYNKFPNESEGVLSQMRMKLVRGKTLAELAVSLRLDNFIIFGASEIKSGGHRKDRILEDVTEATIGAIYLDAGISKAKEVILNWYQEILSNMTVEVVKVKDNKSNLQEILLQNAYELPAYEIVDTAGEEHQQIFTVRVTISSLGIKAESIADSKKKAEQKAAGKMIAILAEKGLHEKKK